MLARCPILCLLSWKGSLLWPKLIICRTTLATAETKGRKLEVFAQSGHLCVLINLWFRPNNPIMHWCSPEWYGSVDIFTKRIITLSYTIMSFHEELGYIIESWTLSKNQKYSEIVHRSNLWQNWFFPFADNFILLFRSEFAQSWVFGSVPVPLNGFYVLLL